MERRAMYNSLRMQWLHDPAMIVEPWQVANYRDFALEDLFSAVNQYGFELDKAAFLQMAEEMDTPEDLTLYLAESHSLDEISQDYIYLVLFELWRRLVPEKRSISIFCDELDYQIHLYETDQLQNPEGLEDALAYMQYILNEAADEGEDPALLFAMVCNGCANDVESFLYEYISECMDFGNDSYASELMEGFSSYVKDTKWFDLLQVRHLLSTEVEEAQTRLPRIVKNSQGIADLEYQLELLALLVQEGGKGDFARVCNNVLPLLKVEEDFQDLLLITEDYFHCLDLEKNEAETKTLHKKRSHIPPSDPVDQNDPDIVKLREIVKK